MAGGSSISRRSLLAGSGALALTGATRGTAAVKRPPNILFILADDLGYADLSCYGRTDYRTPVLDRLAKQGMRLTTAYSNSAVCTATRVALITGRYQYRLPIGLEEPLAGRDVGLPASEPTLPSMLRQAGYATALVGKWHLGLLPRHGPLQSGYDHFWGFRTGAVDYFTHDGGEGPDLWDGDTPIERVGYLTDLLADRTIEQLGAFARERRPFLLSLHLSAPHWPWEGPEDETESRRLVEGKKWLSSADAGDLATYGRMVARMDAQIGRVLTELARLGLERETIVVFTSDNGGERFSNTWPFSGRKTELLEGGIRVPAIVRWPGEVRPGSESAEPVISMDWAPTFLAAAGATSGPFDGIDVAAALAGGRVPDRTLFWRYKALGQRAARRGRWKYLRIKGNEFLFDVVADPLERANLREREPARFAALKGEWEAWNQTMLPLDPKSLSASPSGRQSPDRYGNDD